MAVSGQRRCWRRSTAVQSAFRALNISVPDTSMYSAGSRKPYSPLSRNSTVYVYLTAFTQSSALPDATSTHDARHMPRCLRDLDETVRVYLLTCRYETRNPCTLRRPRQNQETKTEKSITRAERSQPGDPRSSPYTTQVPDWPGQLFPVVTPNHTQAISCPWN